jgi:hypothetical protein
MEVIVDLLKDRAEVDGTLQIIRGKDKKIY